MLVKASHGQGRPRRAPLVMRDAALVATGAAAGAICTALLLRRGGCTDGVEDNDDCWMQLAHSERTKRRARPSQSAFRVTAVVVYCVEGGRVRHVVGHNDEACCLVNSVCAERAAFLQLASHAGAGEVKAVYLSADIPFPITPGALCREYMLSSRFTRTETRVVMEGTAGPPTRVVRTLGSLWPHASVYTRLRRDGQVAAGERLETHLKQRLATLGGDVAQAWRGAVRACSGDDSDSLHPIRYGACVVFEDGSEATACQRKALEYSCSLDAVCQLAPAIAASPSPPAVLCMSDQYGVCHAPFGPARAYLAEHGHGAVRVVAVDSAGQVHVPTAAELMPGLPEWCSACEGPEAGDESISEF